MWSPPMLVMDRGQTLVQVRRLGHTLTVLRRGRDGQQRQTLMRLQRDGEGVLVVDLGDHLIGDHVSHRAAWCQML
jgi:hypothetical protein